MPRLAVAIALVAMRGVAFATEPASETALQRDTEAALPRYTIDARVDHEARTVNGHARILVPNATGAPLGELWLWRYPERFATRSPRLNDYNLHWVYPYRFNPGHMRTTNVTVDGRAVAAEVRDHPLAGKGTLVRLPLEPPLGPGESVVVDVDFATEVPKRYGRFGCSGGTCVLGPGFHPLVAPPSSSSAETLASLPGRGVYTLRLWSRRLADVVVNGELDALPSGGRLTRELGVQAGLALVVGDPKLRKFERVEKGVHITLLAPHGRGTPSPAEYVLPYQPSNRVDRALDTAVEAVDLLSELGAPLPPALTLVEGPLRIELAEPLPGMVLVSDQIFDIFPLQRFLKFHEFDLARALFAEDILARTLLAERQDDLGWSPDVAASHLVDLYTLRSYRKAEFMREIMRYAAFIPAIDRVMYAPQIPFASSYFSTLEDPDPLRDSLGQFDNDFPTGKVIYSKLRDLLGDASINAVTQAQLRGEALRPVAERLRGASLDWFWRQWLGPYPKVDYRFAFVKTERRGREWVVTARVEKRGEHPPVEPVEVRVTDKKGQAQTQVWDGQGRWHDYLFVIANKLQTIEIDPRGRLVEDLPGSNDDLRFDDRRPPRWKFIYNNFGGLLTFFPTLALDLSLDFSLQRILDVKHAMRFVVYRSQSTQIGVLANYTRNYGRKITSANLSSDVFFTLTLARIDPSFAQAIGATPNPGTQLAATVGWDYDDRLFIWEPRRALTLGASVSAHEIILDNRAVLSQGTAAAGWESIVPLADGHGLAMSLGGAITFGNLKIARQMLSAGGGTALRGYSVEQLLGRWNATARIEWRHLFTHNIDFNIMHSLYVRGMSGGLFAEAGVVSPCESYSLDNKSVAADVGYSIRFFADWFGVSQTTLNLDFAVPLVRNDRACFGELASARSSVPLGFFFSFGPPW